MTQFYLQTTPCLPPSHKRSSDGAHTNCDRRHLIAAYYAVTYRPRKDERLRWVISEKEYLRVDFLCAPSVEFYK